MAISGNKGYCLPAAVLSCADKKVPKEPAWGGFEWIASAIQATSPRPHQARFFVFAVLQYLFYVVPCSQHFCYDVKNRVSIDFLVHNCIFIAGRL